VRQSGSQIKAAAPVDRSTAKAGDLVYYPGHVMIYLGVGDAIIHSVQTGRTVEIDTISGRKSGSVRFGDPAPACVTCNPTGALPGGGRQRSLGSSGISNLARQILSRFVSDDGNRVFFESPAKFVGADTNGDASCPNGGGSRDYPACQDVYEWEAPGTGSCTKASTAYSELNKGCFFLISTGTGSNPAFFADASASGDDVFFFTRDQLVPSDHDELMDVYDARVNGGLASQHPSPPPVPCEGQACRGEGSTPPNGSSAGSASFRGPGDPPIKRKPCPKGKVRKGGKCVKKPHKHKKHHKHTR